MKFDDEADMPFVLTDLAEKKVLCLIVRVSWQHFVNSLLHKIEGFKLHVAHITKPFTSKTRYAPEVASRPERLAKDLANAKILATKLEEEYLKLRQTKVELPTDANGSGALGDDSTDQHVDSSTNGTHDDPEPTELGSEAVERRIEKVMADLQSHGLLDGSDQKAIEERRVGVFFIRLVSSVSLTFSRP